MKRKIITMFLLFSCINIICFSATRDFVDFDLKFLNTGETDFNFADYGTSTDPTLIDLISFTFAEDSGTAVPAEDVKPAKAQFGVFWDIFAEENPVYATLSLEFSADSTGSKNYMLENENSANIVLNYSSKIDGYLNKDGTAMTDSNLIEGRIDVPENSIASNSFVNRKMNLFSNYQINPFGVFSGFANITLTLNPPYYDEETNSRYFMNGVYNGYAILSLITN